MSDRPTLIYFKDGGGRAELTRLIFICGNLEFEDKRISWQEFLDMRSSRELPFAQLPILQLGDKTISQSCAISRYVAKEAGLYPQDPIDAAKSDEIVDVWRDLLDIFYGYYVDRGIDGDFFVMKMIDSQIRIARLNDFFKVTLKGYLDTFEKILTNNRSQSSFLVGNSLTWADLAVFDLLNTFDPNNPSWNTEGFFDVATADGPYLDLAEKVPAIANSFIAFSADKKR